ncbi:PaaX family transcriptional regulator C-terminal domain-containing protein [uncultured Roseobacter sp.]|uniref:PaaX family transcriptional regulator C-terminal domain-containing protein n=1 Tax=uncultured Roseobacter sp. TaxID=114847 RepID=UPI002627F7AA|nr:PaaX family transcriptional regulator C-terminal domain-containing protein [uncultured Roseobacter sp.]
MPTELPEDLTRALMAQGGQRVWSLLVSVFGDLAAEDGSALGGPVLSAIMGRMGIRSEATRVALHRLRKDGWITSERAGRTSRHSLTRHGRTETLAASRRIYASTADRPQSWRVIITEAATAESRDALSTADFTPIANRIFLASGDATAPKDALVLSAKAVPEWLRRQVTLAGTLADYAALCAILQRIDDVLPEGTQLDPFDRAVLRCLMVHNWRRLVLKQPDLPDGLFTADWQGPRCRDLVTRLLDRFPRPDLTELST